MNLQQISKQLKSNIKGKVTFTQAVLTLFFITGNLAQAASLSFNDGLEHISDMSAFTPQEHIHSFNPNTSILLSSENVSVNNTSAPKAAVLASNGGKIVFEGNADIRGWYNRYALWAGNGTNPSEIVIKKNLSAQSGAEKPSSSRTIYISHGSNIQVGGYLEAKRWQGFAGSVIQVEANSSLHVAGNMLLDGHADKTNEESISEGLRNAGTVHVGGHLDVSTSFHSKGIRASENSLLQVAGNTNIEIKNSTSDAVGILASGDNTSIVLGNVAKEDGMFLGLQNTKIKLEGEGTAILVNAAQNTSTKESSIKIGDLSKIEVGKTVLSANGEKIQVENAGKLLSEQGPAINFSEISKDSSFVNRGEISLNDENNIAILGGISSDKVVNTGTIKGSLDLQDGDDSLEWSDGQLHKFLGGNGSDTAIISSKFYTGEQVLDGGDDRESSDQFIDHLSLQNYSNLEIDANNVINWEKISLDNSNVTFKNAPLATGKEKDTGLFLSNHSSLIAESGMILDGNLNIDANSLLKNKEQEDGEYNILGSLTQKGKINLQNKVPGNKLIIHGDYEASPSSSIAIDTVLGDDHSATDTLHIKGDTSGSSRIFIQNIQGRGAQTKIGIPIIQIDGKSAADFYLAQPVQAGLYEYVLGKNDKQNFYLNSQIIETPSLTKPMNPIAPKTPEVENPKTPIYRPGVANYLTSLKANQEQGFLSLGSYHERRGEDQIILPEEQTWLHLYGNKEKNRGKDRFGYEQSTRGFQLGQDLYTKEENNQRKNLGIFVDYSEAHIKGEDRLRSKAQLSEKTGNIESRSLGLGAYYTLLKGDNSYLDTVVFMSKLRNEFQDSYGDSSFQRGYRLAFSLEGGKKIYETKNWKYEAQAQLMYQHNKYKGFEDQFSQFPDSRTQSLRGRIGLRAYKNNDKYQTYGVVNLYQDLISKHRFVDIQEKYDKTSYEFGFGLQKEVISGGLVYGDLRYRASFSGRDREWKANLGIKYTF